MLNETFAVIFKHCGLDLSFFLRSLRQMRKLEVVTSVPQAVVDVTNEMGKVLPTTPKQTMYIATPTKSSIKRKAKSAIKSKIRTTSRASMPRQKSNLSKK